MVLCKKMLSRKRLPHTAYRLLSAVVCLALAGCPRPEAGTNGSPDSTPLAGVKLRLLVVDDPAMAAAVGRLQGEWEAQTGSEFQVEQTTEEELNKAERLPADAVICPSYLLGALAERKLIAPLPKKSTGHDGGQSAGVFELLGLRQAAWGTDIYAVPFGSPVLVCYCRADLLERLGRRPPQTWAEYQRLAELLADRSNFGFRDSPQVVTPWSGVIEPLGRGWAALVLLARAAPYAKHRDNYSTLFDINTMEPLVAGEPFVRALEELLAAARLGPKEQLQYDPAAVRAAFWRGECGMALSWPTAAARLNAKPSVEENIAVGFAELPGSQQVYNFGTGTWEDRPNDQRHHVPLLSIAGRVGVVAAGSDHPLPVTQLLRWLSGRRFSTQVCAVSESTTLFRRSHIEHPGSWVEKPVSASAAARYAAVTEATLQHQQWLSALRIPGRSEYISALDTAVRSAVRGEQSSSEALQQASEQWQEITRRLGARRQRSAYLHSLGAE